MRGNLFIRQTLHHHLEHFPLPQGEVFWRSVGDGSGASHRVAGFLAGMSEQILAHEIGQIARERKQSGRGADKICFVGQQYDWDFESDQFFPIYLRRLSFEVQEHYVGIVLRDCRWQAAGAANHAHKVYAGLLLEQALQSCAGDRRGSGDQHAQRLDGRLMVRCLTHGAEPAARHIYRLGRSPSVTSASVAFPARSTRSFTASPVRFSASMWWKWRNPWTGCASTPVIRSPRLMPARLAGPSGATCMTRRPCS